MHLFFLATCFVFLAAVTWAQDQTTATAPLGQTATMPVATTAVANSSPVAPAFVPQTQMNLSGDLDVDLKQAKVNDNVLTVVLVYRNSGQKEVSVRYGVDNVYFIDKKENKKYSVLKDEKGEWIAAPVARGSIGFEGTTGASPLEVGPGDKKVVWFKFPAPPETSPIINVIIPDTLPFEGVAVERLVNTN